MIAFVCVNVCSRCVFSETVFCKDRDRHSAWTSSWFNIKGTRNNPEFKSWEIRYSAEILQFCAKKRQNSFTNGLFGPCFCLWMIFFFGISQILLSFFLCCRWKVFVFYSWFGALDAKKETSSYFLQRWFDWWLLFGDKCTFWVTDLHKSWFIWWKKPKWTIYEIVVFCGSWWCFGFWLYSILCCLLSCCCLDT